MRDPLTECRLPGWRLRGALVTLLLVLPVGACREGSRTVTLFAAASLHDALDEAAEAYYRQHGVQIEASYGASSTLARQIAEGAPADLYLSADAEWPVWLRERVANAAAPVLLATNALVLVAPAKRRFAWTAGEPLAQAFPGRLALAEPEHVPAGRYAREALEKLGDWPALEARVLAASDVRAALRLVALGEADAGIVYATDVTEADGTVAIVARLAPTLHAAIHYTGLLLDTPARERAGGFLAFLASPAGSAIFVRHGFLPPTP